MTLRVDFGMGLALFELERHCILVIFILLLGVGPVRFLYFLDHVENAIFRTITLILLFYFKN